TSISNLTSSKSDKRGKYLAVLSIKCSSRREESTRALAVDTGYSGKPAHQVARVKDGKQQSPAESKPLIVVCIEDLLAYQVCCTNTLFVKKIATHPSDTAPKPQILNIWTDAGAEQLD
ncbi:mCG19475, partial [Mus musculus]